MLRLKLILVYILCTQLTSFSQSSEEALNYLKETTSSLDEFRAETWKALSSSVQNRSSSELEWKIKTLSEKMNAERARLTAADGFYGDLAVKVAMTVFLKNSSSILTEDYKKIKMLEQRSQSSYLDMEKYLNAQNKANDRLSEAGQRLDGELKRFARRYDLEVSEEKHPLAKKIEKASLALGYYNQVYLTYFQVYTKKYKVYEVLKTEDMSAIKTEMEELDKICNAAIEKLALLDSFMGDNLLNESATAIIQQTREESKLAFPAALRAIEKKHILYMAQEVFDQIPEDERTKEDVDHINGLIDPLNSAIDRQNKEFSAAEHSRLALFNQWTVELKNFTQKYLQ